MMPHLGSVCGLSAPYHSLYTVACMALTSLHRCIANLQSCSGMHRPSLRSLVRSSGYILVVGGIQSHPQLVPEPGFHV